ncbi:MAG: type VI secretion system contractile sheath large subunit [Isosphaeraceae bacterium]
MSTDATPEPQAQAAATTAAEAGPGLLDEIYKATRARDPEQQAYERDLVGQLVKDVMQGEIKVAGDTEAMINARIAQIDALLSEQLNAIMHQEEFQKLESSWRGLHYLVDQSNTNDKLQIRVLNATKRDILRDMERASEFDQSKLFKLIYTSEYDQFGGSPYGALIGDYEFGKHPQDVALLQKIAGVAAAAHAPFVAGTNPDLLGLGSFTELPDPRALSEVFRAADYIKWRSFREHPDSRYVGLCLPHILLRLPYGPDTKPVDAFDFREDVTGRDHAKYLWGNASYAFAARLTDAFDKFGWCTAIRGPENGGLVLDLPVHTFETDDGEVAPKCPTEVAISDRREKELADLGLIALLHCKNTDFAAFFAAQSCQKPTEYNTDSATANARLSTQLPYMFMVSRFAHYMKCIMRDKIGSFMSREDVSRFMNRWIQDYVLEMDEASQEMKAKQPLRAARIDVEDDPRRPGCYRAVSYLRPHFMLDELSISLRLVSELPPPRNR